MEFGVFLNGYIPGPGAHDTAWEHQQLLREGEYAVFADKHNWKYAWFGEHHALTEYSHMSAPEVVMGWVAAQTDYIHLGTAINSLSPRKEHPVRYAERAAMLDHFTNNRFEWGTGRGAGSHEMASFNILDKDSTKPEWEEVVHEIPRMWEQVDYSFQGDHFTVPTPHNVLPKPYGKGHPPIWVACGNPPTFARAGELGIGAIAFNFEPIYNLRGRIEAYKEAIAECREPLGQYMNDNIMMTNAVICLADRDRARKLALERVTGYLVTMVNLYHDTMPKSPDAIVWPNAPIQLRELGASDPEALLDEMIAGGYMMVGNPDEVSEQLNAYSDVGCDQLVFGLPGDMHPDEILELIELFGDKVIPEHDKDRVHSTDRYRAKAVPKYSRINEPLPDIVWPTVLPVTAGP
ncbi:MAG: LLM class flavin-dependent oxidoreductase [Acidimicrobiia bacterium]|nr:LLM class flavin-dependent oxidoreductase [Acidimicrobiia bacterium]